MDLAGLHQGNGEGRLAFAVVLDLARDVADNPAQPGAQELDPPVHALELLGVRVAPGHQRRPLSDARIGLAQRYALRLGQLAELVDRGLQQFGVGREGDVLGLHRGVRRYPGKITLLQRAGAVRNTQGLL